MYEYEIINKTATEVRWICGYSFTDACRRKGYDPADWIVIFSDYVD